MVLRKILLNSFIQATQNLT